MSTIYDLRFTIYGRCRFKLTVSLVLTVFALGLRASADDFAALCADRAAIERVYYDHRLGTKPPFEQLLPPPAVEKLVREDRKKETVLRKAYSSEMTAAQVEAEVKRIEATTRAPEMLAELKRALGNDPVRFARTVARPLVVERELRRRFEGDDRMHSTQRRQAERVREALLRAKNAGVPLDQLVSLLKTNTAGVINETTWQLAPAAARPSGRKPSIGELSPPSALNPQLSAPARSIGGPYTLEGTAQPLLSTPRDGERREIHFEDLAPELQRVLHAQLQKAGDVSAVIETASGFLVFLTKDRTAQTLNVASWSIPKRSLEQWLAEQN